MSNSDDTRESRIARSPQFRAGRFRNRLPRIDGAMWRAFGEFFFGGSKHRRPKSPIPLEPRTAADYAAAPSSGLRVTWLGHSTTLLEIEDVRLLIDPVWAERASFVSFAGPRRFFPPPLPLAELPPIDAIVLSHDHYDHLDESFVRAIAARGTRWIAPLGVGRWLEEREYSSVEEARGSLSQAASPDPAAFERSNYMRAVVSFTSPFGNTMNSAAGSRSR